MRTRLLLLATITALVLGVGGCRGSACDRGKLEKVQQVLDTISKSDRAMVGFMGIGESCKLPSGVAPITERIGNVDPSMRSALITQALTETPSFASSACPSFRETFGALASTPPEGKGKLLYEGCDYQKLGLVTAEEFTLAEERDFASVLLGPPLYQWLVDNGVDRNDARILIRSSMGF